MVLGRVRLDLLEAREVMPPREYEVTFQRTLLRHERREAHADLERDSALLGYDLDRADLANECQESVEDLPHARFALGKKWLQIEPTAAVPLVPGGETLTALRALPQ